MNFEHLNFGFVSDFDIRISDLLVLSKRHSCQVNYFFPLSHGKNPYPYGLKACLKTVFSFPCMVPIALNKRIFDNFKALNGIT